MQKGTSGPHLNYYMLGHWNEISFAYRWMMHSNESLSPWWKSIMSSPGIHGFVSSNLSLQYRKIMECKQSVLILIKVNWFTFIRNLDYNFMFSSINTFAGWFIQKNWLIFAIKYRQQAWNYQLFLQFYRSRRNAKRKTIDSSDQATDPSFKNIRRCPHSGCPTKVPICFAGATERCVS